MYTKCKEDDRRPLKTALIAKPGTLQMCVPKMTFTDELLTQRWTFIPDFVI